ncbi:hypothetical protein APY04_3353 [Hyphomicrobium sulfonivorans]|uniref:Uncharacterized protein n=1 Tax=Hyphomicrobium sulfonivorans TaxID=121290 RepID=A0A109B8V3_HYPSL|nr:hypothetical protein APY04_3353 [Hyphomicrobium sulfonivorans]
MHPRGNTAITGLFHSCVSLHTNPPHSYPIDRQFPWFPSSLEP